MSSAAHWVLGAKHQITTQVHKLFIYIHVYISQRFYIHTCIYITNILYTYMYIYQVLFFPPCISNEAQTCVCGTDNRWRETKDTVLRNIRYNYGRKEEEDRTVSAGSHISDRNLKWRLFRGVTAGLQMQQQDIDNANGLKKPGCKNWTEIRNSFSSKDGKRRVATSPVAQLMSEVLNVSFAASIVIIEHQNVSFLFFFFLSWLILCVQEHPSPNWCPFFLFRLLLLCTRTFLFSSSFSSG